MASAQVQRFEFEKQQDHHQHQHQHQHQQLDNIQKHQHHEGVPQESKREGPGPIDEELHHVEYRHPLEHVWTLWYLENDRTKHWKDMLNEVTEIDSVETFWSLYYTIKSPSELKIGCDYSMFKKSIKPMWEDEANIKGGRWLITAGKSAKVDLDRIWLDILLMMVGQNFHYSDEICGAVINIRAKSNKISVWTANGSNEMAILEIGQKLKILLHVPSHNLQYQLHSDAMCKLNSGVKSVYTL